VQATKLYQKLEKDFILPTMIDNWIEYMSEIRNFLSQEFLDREMGVVCDFTNDLGQLN
jgi:hypothetical protein